MSRTWRQARAARAPAIACCLLLLAGCAEQIDTVYGHRLGRFSGKSVNGTAVLAGMFEQAGHRVRSWRYLSPRLQEADTIVWFPDDFQPPSEEQRQWLEKWLYDSEGRTLIYVGRDYDAEAAYWAAIQPVAPAEQQAEVSRLLRDAQRLFSSNRADVPQNEDCDWFRVQNAVARRSGATWGGPWTQGVDTTRLEIELNGPMQVRGGDAVWLKYGNEPVVSRRPFTGWDGESGTTSQLIVVANGSFLLNYPLINHEHRKLAGKLVDAAGPPGTVVFLESGPGGPDILDKDPQGEAPTGAKVFFVWPLNYILLHLALAGVIFCFSRWPIFGPIKPLPADPPSDFGKHVAAVGELISRTNNSAYAWTHLHQYHQLMQEPSPGGKPFKASPP